MRIRPTLALIIGAVAALAAPLARAAPTTPFVLVSTNTEIHRYALDGTYQGLFLPGTDPTAAAPQHMALGPDGLVYVANFFGEVQAYGLDGTHARTVRPATIGQAAWLGFDGGNLIVSDRDANRVRRFDVLDGDAELADPLTIPAGRTAPHSVFRTVAGELLVSLNPNVVSRFDADGNFIDDFITVGLARPLTILGNGDELIVSNFNGAVRRYDAASGEPLGRFTSDTGSSPDGLARLPNGNVLVSFFNSSVVKEYTSEGELVGEFASFVGLPDGRQRPNAVLVVLPAPASGAAIALAGLVATARRRR